VFLAVIAMGGMLALQTVSARWDKGISGTLTVQITPVDDPAKDFERLQAVLAVLAETPEIARYESLDDDRLMQLLQPWRRPPPPATCRSRG
jgi:cell division transport system permease protein